MFNNSSYKINNTDKLIVKNAIDKLHQDDRKGLNQLIELFSYQEKIIDFIIYYWNSTKYPNSQF
jgi:hypothetical protein